MDGLFTFLEWHVVRENKRANRKENLFNLNLEAVGNWTNHYGKFRCKYELPAYSVYLMLQIRQIAASSGGPTIFIQKIFSKNFSVYLEQNSKESKPYLGAVYTTPDKFLPGQIIIRI